MFFMSGSMIEQMELQFRPRLYEACLIGIDSDVARRKQILERLVRRNKETQRESLESLKQKASGVNPSG